MQHTIHEPSRLTALLATVFTLAVTSSAGCDPADVEADALDAVEHRELGRSASAEERRAEVIEPEFFPDAEPWPSDYDLAVEDGTFDAPGMSLTAPTDPLASFGSRPIHIQRYGPFATGGVLNTGIPTCCWIASVVGFQTINGDINEVGTGNPISVFPFQSSGSWHVSFDLRSHNVHEDWTLWVMFIDRDTASSTNF